MKEIKLGRLMIRLYWSFGMYGLSLSIPKFSTTYTTYCLAIAWPPFWKYTAGHWTHTGHEQGTTADNTKCYSAGDKGD